MQLRKGTKEDLPRCLELIIELAAFEKAEEQVVTTVESMLEDGFGSNSIYEFYVAEEGTHIVGIALYYYRYSTWKGKTIHLEDLIVKEDMRGSGLGFELYSKIIEQGKIDKVRRIEWAVLDWNISAIEFYQKSGAKILEDWRVAQMDENGINEFLSKL